MTIAVMQPYLFPYIGYWQLINAVDTFVIFDDVHFIKKGYINKNAFLVNGRAQNFTLELLKASQNRLINEIKIGDNGGKILKTIEMAYKKAPFFEAVFPLILKILTQKEKNLSKFIGYSLLVLSHYMELDTHFVYSSEIEKDNRFKAQEKIIDICKNLKAADYINAIGGRDLYSKEKFAKEGVELHFLKSRSVEYKQFKNEFIPSLSIVDVLMFNDKDALKEMLECYSLV